MKCEDGSEMLIPLRVEFMEGAGWYDLEDISKREKKE